MVFWLLPPRVKQSLRIYFSPNANAGCGRSWAGVVALIVPAHVSVLHAPHKNSYTFGLLSEFPAPGRVNDNIGKAKVEWEMSPGACEWPPLTWNRNCHGQNSERNSGKQILGHKLPLRAKFSVYNEEGWRIFAYPAFSACFRVSHCSSLFPTDFGSSGGRPWGHIFRRTPVSSRS